MKKMRVNQNLKIKNDEFAFTFRLFSLNFSSAFILQNVCEINQLIRRSSFTHVLPRNRKALGILSNQSVIPTIFQKLCWNHFHFRKNYFCYVYIINMDPKIYHFKANIHENVLFFPILFEIFIFNYHLINFLNEKVKNARLSTK